VIFRDGCFATAFVLCATLAAGQDRPTISLSAPDPARWDAAGYAGWTGANRTARGATFDQWGDAASFGASGGYYWTPHIKLELQFAATTRGTVFVQEPVDGGPSFRFGQEHFRSDHLMAALHYQFFENTWFHPFAAAGLAGTRESSQIALAEQRPCPPLSCSVPLPREFSVSFHARPFVGTGFKWYFNERGFIRSDIRVLLPTATRVAVHWHTGLGVDF
jgi:hypothetical protein